MNTEFDELNWLAFQYVTGDLSPEAHEAFENRLGDDQEAREAVASAVALHDEIVNACRLAPPLPSIAARPSRSLNRIAVAFVVVAAVIVAVLCIPKMIKQPESNPQSPSGIELRGDLALMWSQTRDSSDDAANEPTEAADPADDTADLAFDEAAIEAMVTPSWIDAAVSLYDDGPLHKTEGL